MLLLAQPLGAGEDFDGVGDDDGVDGDDGIGNSDDGDGDDGVGNSDDCQGSWNGRRDDEGGGGKGSDFWRR